MKIFKQKYNGIKIKKRKNITYEGVDNKKKPYRAKKLLKAERKLQAIQYRKQGRSYYWIGKKLGVVP